MGCTLIECQANRIRAGNYKERLESCQEAIKRKNESIAKLEGISNVLYTQLKDTMGCYCDILVEKGQCGVCFFEEALEAHKKGK